MAVDWFSSELDHTLVAKMVDPIDHSSVLGFLDIYASGSVRYDKTTDTVASAVINAIDWSEWIENSWIRLEHRVEGTDFEEVLGTFFVWDEGTSYTLDSYEASPQLYSSLKALGDDRLYTHMIVGIGASLKTAIMRVCDSTHRRYRFESGTADYIFVSPHMYDAGDSRLDTLLDLAATGGMEVVPSDDGYLLFKKRYAPFQKSPLFAIDCNAPNTIVFENSVRPISNKRQAANRSIALYKGEDEYDIVSAYADVAVSDPISPERRGYVISEFHEITDSYASDSVYAAYEKAKEFLVADSRLTEGYMFNCNYLPIRAGDVISFCAPGSSQFQNMEIISVEIDFSNWTMSVEANFA